MKYRTLGQGLEVSAIGIGCMPMVRGGNITYGATAEDDESIATIHHAIERGVRVAMGTDGVAGEHLPRELSHMVEHGMTPLAALRSATMEAARLLDLADDVGTLEPGKIADLAVVNGDPLSVPALWADPARVVAVVQGGKIVANRT